MGVCMVSLVKKPFQDYKTQARQNFAPVFPTKFWQNHSTTHKSPKMQQSFFIVYFFKHAEELHVIPLRI